MAKKIELEILNPRGEVDVVPREPARRLKSLEGRTLALIDNTKSGAREFLTLIRGYLQRDVPGIRFVELSKKFNEQHRMEKYLPQLAGIDAAIYSTGD
jgi:hypothetical protein